MSDWLTSSDWLRTYQSNVFSQNGEDGVLRAIFSCIGEQSRWCVELGAWDGELFSNTRDLIRQGWTGVLFEADRERFHELLLNHPGSGFVYAENLLVDDLDEALSKYEIPYDFDLLSIDIDGGDYQLWKKMVNYKPRVVVIEVNSSVPVESEWQYNNERGTGIRAMVRLAKSKGYELALHTGNAIFVREDYAGALGIDRNNWTRLFDDSWVTK